MTKAPSKPRTVAPKDDRTAAARAMVTHLRLAVDELERLLTGSADAQPPLVEREVMKPGEYADRLRVSVSKVHRWIKKGMPHFQIEGRVRIRVREADDWLDANARAASDKQPDA